MKLFIKTSNIPCQIMSGGFTIDQISEAMRNGGKTGKLYQSVIINYKRWKENLETNGQFSSERKVKNKWIKTQIKTLSESGIDWIQACKLGSKSTYGEKLKSLQQKLTILGPDGEFAFYDNSNWCPLFPYIDLYQINVEDWIYLFGKTTIHTSYKDMMLYIDQYS